MSNDLGTLDASLLQGMPHALVFSNALGEPSVFVPAVPPIRPVISAAPFTCELVLERSGAKADEFRAACGVPVFIYPVHLSLCFLAPPTLASACYLLLCRYNARMYAEAVAGVDTIACDGQLTTEQQQILAHFTSDDRQPDASACRLKISAALLYSNAKLSWTITEELANYVAKREVVSSACELIVAEELFLFDSPECVCDPADPRAATAKVSHLDLIRLFNRRLVLQHTTKARLTTCAIPRIDESVKSSAPLALLCPSQPKPWEWTTEFHGNLLDPSSQGEELDNLLKATTMEYHHTPRFDLSAACGLLRRVNLNNSNVEHFFSLNPDKDGFLILYSLFQGGSKFSVVGRTDAGGTTFATLLTAMAIDKACALHGKTLLTSILLALARVHSCEGGAFLPALKHSNSHKYAGVPDASTEPPSLYDLTRTKAATGTDAKPKGPPATSLATLLRSIVTEMQGLAAGDELVAAQMMERAKAAISSSDEGDGDRGWGGHSGGRWGWHGSNNSWGGAAGSWTARNLNGSDGGASGSGCAQVPPEADVQDDTSTDESLEQRLAELSKWHHYSEPHLPADPSTPPVKPVFVARAAQSQIPWVADYGREHHKLNATPELDDAALVCLATSPLDGLSAGVIAQVPSSITVSPELGISKYVDLTTHPDVRHSNLARAMLLRLTSDAAIYAAEKNAKLTAQLLLLDGDTDKVDESLLVLLRQLTELRDTDAGAVGRALPALVARANLVADPDAAARPPPSPVGKQDVQQPQDESHQRERELHRLEQLAGSKAPMPIAFLLSTLLTVEGTCAITRLNPWVDDVAALHDQLVAAVLRTTRAGILNRAINEVTGLLKLRRSNAGSSALALKSSTLASALLVRRHFVDLSDTSAPSIDPRLLLFEFTHNLVLREPQVALVHEFVEAARSGKPLVKQMLMGGGKTTVVRLPNSELARGPHMSPSPFTHGLVAHVSLVCLKSRPQRWARSSHCSLELQTASSSKQCRRHCLRSRRPLSASPSPASSRSGYTR